MLVEIVVALGLMLVLEGFFPFLAPDRFRMAIQRLVTFSDDELRWVGFISILLGLTMVKLFR